MDACVKRVNKSMLGGRNSGILGLFHFVPGAASETAADAKVETACAAILESILKT